MSVPSFQKIVINGRSRLLTVTKYVPPDWRLVEVTKLEEGNNYVILKVRKVELS